jgi:hypothetical protein
VAVRHYFIFAVLMRKNYNEPNIKVNIGFLILISYCYQKSVLKYFYNIIYYFPKNRKFFPQKSPLLHENTR